MARSVGPILALGAVTIINRSIVHDEPMDWKIPIATGATAAAFALLEKGWEDAAVGLAWLALLVTLFVRVDPKVPSVAESLLAAWNKN